MATYVLIHGAWHGGWCWHRIVAPLARAGHQQRRMQAALPCRERTTLDTDHSSFFSRPAELAAAT